MPLADIHRDGSDVHFNVFTKQKEFLDAQEDDVLFGGAAGPGKSFGLLLFMLKRRMEYPGSFGIAFRRTYPELQRSLVVDSFKIFPQVGARYNEQKHIWRFPNGSLQEFGHCERDKDVYNYQSASYQDICFDELTHFNEFQFGYLTSRCRSAVPAMQALIRAASNPGGVGHYWVHKRYVKPWETNRKWRDPATKKTMTFIPARISDNPALMENDPGYMDRLRELPEKKYLALAEGRWDVFEGAYFTEWNPQGGQSVLPYARIPEGYTLKFLSLDWGFVDPACVLWYEITPMGRVFVYRELYITQKSPKELAKLILEMSPDSEEYLGLYASPEIWGKKADHEAGGESIQELIQGALGNRVIMQKAMNARVPGWLKVKEYMSKAPDGRPWMQVSPTCTNLIRTIPGAVHDDKKVEDIDESCEDHAIESLRYGVTTLNSVPRSDKKNDMAGYESIFGIQSRGSDNQSFIPMPGRSGYGF